jgi:hypothetical protein
MSYYDSIYNKEDVMTSQTEYGPKIRKRLFRDTRPRNVLGQPVEAVEETVEEVVEEKPKKKKKATKKK